MSWVFGPGGGGTPGGADKDIQFNNNGEFSGSNLLTTDGSGSLSASVHVSASTYYGDGSNLTGVTASAVNVADGPEFSLQFRRDTPVTGEISGSENFSVSSDMTKLFLTGTLIASGATAANIEGPVIITSPEGKLEVQDTTNNYQVSLVPAAIPRVAFGTISNETQYMVIDGGNTNRIITNNDFFIATSSTYSQGLYYDASTERIGVNTSTPNHDFTVSGSISGSGNISGSNFYTNNNLYADRAYLGVAGSGFIVSRTDATTFMKMQTVGGNNSISFTLGGAKLVDILENGVDQVSLGATSGDTIYISGSLTASVGMRVSASAAIGNDIIVGAGSTRTIGVDMDGTDDFFVMGNAGGAVTLSASSGVEFLADDAEGVMAIATPITVFSDLDANNAVVSLSTSGNITLSGSFSGQQRSKIIFGDNENSKLERTHDSGDELLRLTSEDAGIDISGSHASGVSIYGGDGPSAGFLVHGSSGLTVVNAAGNAAAVKLDQDGRISGSGQLQGASVAVDGIVQTHRVQIDDGSQLGTDSDTDMITLNNGSDVTIASDLELRVGNLTQNRVATVGANSKLTDHSNFTFASDVLSVPTITASVGIETVDIQAETLEVSSSDNGSISIGEGISYVYDGVDRFEIFENEFKFQNVNLYQGVSAENTSNFNIRDKQVFLVDTNSSVVTGTLPGVNSSDDYGVTFIIKDSGGNANTNNVVIEPSGSQTIDGGSAAKIETNYGAITVVAISSSVNGEGWAIVSTT